MAAALQRLGAHAVNHAIAAQCNFGETQPRCMEIGLTEAGFDCSGLAYASLGLPPVEHLRHVRQLYGLSVPFEGQELLPGDMPIFGRMYDFADGPKEVAGHMGIVVAAHERGVYDFVHTTASRQRVERGRLVLAKRRPLLHILGVVQPELMLQYQMAC